MFDKFFVFWHKLSMIGLKNHENVLEFRNVIIINRLLFVFELVLLFYLPIELIFNGLELIPLVLLLMSLIAIPFYFQSKRLFNLSRYYIFIIGICFICMAGLLVGKETGNYIAFVPIVMVGIILFPTRKQKFISFTILLSIYFLQLYLFKITDPLFILPTETKEHFSIIFFSLALVFNFILGYHLTTVNNEFEDIITLQKNELTTKNLEITDSITYAKRIQKAILAPEKLIKDLLKEVFILYLPKDIVAGDFYWLEKKNDLVYVAVADCTGHGVPGAMVSVVCNNALKRSLFEFGLINPADILNQSREIIIQEFKHSEEEIKDGMDISLCAFDFNKQKLFWAGAHNPLIIIRNGEWLEYKANRQPVGVHIDMQGFTNHEIKLEKDDMIYLFSDGYTDQFGGEKGKKLKIKVLKKMLIDLHQEHLEQQKDKLFHAFHRWKGENEQVDDVCIVGIKI
jgi:serine phosphatase RsbU (regulator of sigma subunit)